MSCTIEDGFFTAADGLTLHYIDIRPTEGDGHPPAVCLPGLTRSAADFVVLGKALASGSSPRRVVALDYRGRGLSDHDPDWRHYSLDMERADFLRGLATLRIERAHFLGTSRGGLHIMALAATNREMIISAVFNDIGPVIELGGLRRIKRYVGVPAAPATFDEAMAILKSGSGAGFDGLDEAGWRHFAETTFGTDERALHYRYDHLLARTLDALDLTRPLAESWALFDHLRGLPTLTLRGANSDLLSAETLAMMGTRWPGCETLVVPGQGHAPLLVDHLCLNRIDDFLRTTH